MIEVTTSAILGIPAVVAGSAVVRDFLKRVLAPVADEAGKAIAHPFREWNEKRVRLGQQTVEAAAGMLDAVGRPATAVPGRVLFPLLQAASIEEDEALRRMWATLLAHSADSARGADMMPAFVSILKELTPVEAQVLECVYFDDSPGGAPRIGYLPDDHRFYPSGMTLFAATDSESMTEVALPFGNFRLMSDNLGRLGSA